MNNLNKVIFCTENSLKLPSVVSSNPFETGNFLCNKTLVRFIVSSESHWLLDNSFSMKLLCTCLKRIFNLFFCSTVSFVLSILWYNNMKVQNYRVTKSSHKIKLRKMTSYFELLTRLRKTFKFHFELLTRKLNFYFSTFELLSLILL